MEKSQDDTLAGVRLVPAFLLLRQESVVSTAEHVPGFRARAEGKGATGLIPTRHSVTGILPSFSSPPRTHPRWRQRTPATPKRCPVCQKRNCHLRTHQAFAKAKPNFDSDGFTLSRSPSSNGGLDPFIALPINNASSKTTALFRDFFTSQCSALDQYPRILAFDFAYVPKMAEVAYIDEVTCHSCIAMAATYAAIHGRGRETPDKELSITYEMALLVLRARLAQETGRPQSSTVMAAVNLIMAQAIGMGDQAALLAHRDGIKEFVNACGGMHHLEPQLMSLILWTDYWATLFTETQPLYADVFPIVDVRLENAPPQVCGQAFDAARMSRIADQALLKNCSTTARLVELVEDKVHGTSGNSRWRYFIYKRDWIAARNAVVHSERFGEGSQAECLGLAMNLMLLLVLRMVPWKRPANEVCDQLKKALLKSGASQTFWRTDIDILIYILFVLLAAASHWHDDEWAFRLLRECLLAKNGQIPSYWPRDWQQREALNLERFVWSKVVPGKSASIFEFPSNASFGHRSLETVDTIKERATL